MIFHRIARGVSALIGRGSDRAKPNQSTYTMMGSECSLPFVYCR